jgi:hypothetical protein
VRGRDWRNVHECEDGTGVTCTSARTGLAQRARVRGRDWCNMHECEDGTGATCMGAGGRVRGRDWRNVHGCVEASARTLTLTLMPRERIFASVCLLLSFSTGDDAGRGEADVRCRCTPRHRNVAWRGWRGVSCRAVPCRSPCGCSSEQCKNNIVSV